jgi:hypothetical protein
MVILSLAIYPIATKQEGCNDATCIQCLAHDDKNNKHTNMTKYENDHNDKKVECSLSNSLWLENGLDRGIRGNTFGTSKLHSKFDIDSFVPNIECEVKTIGCFMLANTCFEGKVNDDFVEKDKECIDTLG